MVELKGSLSGLGLPAIVQLIGELHHSGTLRLTRGDTTGILAFDNGRLVAAEYGAARGLQALAALTLDLADAEFTFVDVDPTVDRTLDLGSADLKALLNRVMSGEFVEDLVPVIGSNPAEQALDLTCPLLGFADERGRHYSRPTALHRCYASGAASLVSAQEQRDLCLSGRFATCPRYRNTEHAQPAAASAPEAAIRSSLLNAADEPAPEVPDGVAARLAARSETHVSPAPAAREVPAWVGHDQTAPNRAAEAPEKKDPPAKPPRRNTVFVAAGAGVGLAIVGLVILVAGPALSGGVAPKQPPAAPAIEVVPTATRVLAPAAKATSVAAVSSTPASAPRQGSPTAVPKPTIAVAAARSLMDVRFAGGPAPRWVDNPPFAAWSDGAFRLQARLPAKFVAVGVPIDQVLSDVVVSATFRKTGGPPGGGYGLIVRDQGPEPRDGVNQQVNAYVLETGDVGEFGVWRRDGDHWVDLVPWTRSPSVRVGGSPNDLLVRALDDHLTFMVNGTQVAAVQDDTFMAGGVGLFVGGDNNEVALDHFAVQLPD